MLPRFGLGRTSWSCLNSVRNQAKRSVYTNVKPVSKEYSEVEIKVPWGKVTGKLWGSENVRPILAVHGWQDNAGSYDILAPLLTKNASILAIDLPGHGLSSWLPPGNLYDEYIYVLLIQRIKRYFGWDRLKIMGHSMGAQTLFWHTAIFNKDTDFVIAIDALKPVSMNIPYFYGLFYKSVDRFFKIETSESSNQSYTKEEIVSRWKQNALCDTQDIVIETLMARGTKETEDGKLIITRDPRLRVIPAVCAFTTDHLRSAAKLISCPYLFIKAKNSPYFEEKENVHDILNVMQKNNEKVHYEELEGEHHLHITNAEQVASRINAFLEKYDA